MFLEESRKKIKRKKTNISAFERAVWWVGVR